MGARKDTMSDRKAVVKNADMAEDMQQDAIDCAAQAMEKYNIEKDIAAYIKKEFDKKYNPTWHCIVGRNFGSYVTHETISSTSTSARLPSCSSSQAKLIFTSWESCRDFQHIQQSKVLVVARRTCCFARAWRARLHSADKLSG